MSKIENTDTKIGVISVTTQFRLKYGDEHFTVFLPKFMAVYVEGVAEYSAIERSVDIKE